MGFLDSLERGLERAVNGAFARTFRSSLQPLEITAALRSEIDTESQLLARDYALAPNEFRVHISRKDFDRLKQLGSALTDGFVQQLQQHAAKQNYRFQGPLVVAIVPDDSVGVGRLEISSRIGGHGEMQLDAELVADGRSHRLRRGQTVIGRSQTCDVVISDSAASKRHASVSWDGAHAVLQDLDSTNGTRMDGRRVSRVELPSPATFVVGSTTVEFRVVPRLAGS